MSKPFSQNTANNSAGPASSSLGNHNIPSQPPQGSMSAQSKALQNFRGPQKDGYHQLLNKENKALQNLLAAVELNRTMGHYPPQAQQNDGGKRPVASASQHMHLMQLNQQQVIQQQQQQAQSKIFIIEIYSICLVYKRSLLITQRVWERAFEQCDSSHASIAATCKSFEQHSPPDLEHKGCSQQCAVNQWWQQHYQIGFKNAKSIEPASASTAANSAGASANTPNMSGGAKSHHHSLHPTSTSNQRNTIHHQMNESGPHPDPVARAQTSQAIKTFDGSATSGVRNTSSSSGYQASRGNIGAGISDPIRRKTQHMPPSVQINQRRLAGGELMKVGQKLTTLGDANVTGKASSFIIGSTQPIQSQQQQHTEEEKNSSANISMLPPQHNNTMANGNSQSNASLHYNAVTPTISVKPQTTTNGALMSRASASSAQQHLLLPKASGGFTNHLGGYTSSRGGLNTTTSASGHGGIVSMVHQKLQQSSKTNLHSKQMHIVIEDKENRRDMVNRQSTNGTAMPSLGATAGVQQLAQTSNFNNSSSTTSLLKRSKTSDPSRAPLRQKDTAATQAIQNQKQSVPVSVTSSNQSEAITI